MWEVTDVWEKEAIVLGADLTVTITPEKMMRTSRPIVVGHDDIDVEAGCRKTHQPTGKSAQLHAGEGEYNTVGIVGH